MSRTATRGSKTAPASAPATTEGPARPKESNRETVESIVVAFILALLIRGFEAEAFVIPTGSMAPTLMGRHKEITCPECGYVYSVNASEEAEAAFNRPGPQVELGTCVNCRLQTRVDREPSFKGDRILVMKFLYDLPFLPGGGRPDRWDVIVFKYPEDPETNYIKRLVGMPDEEVRIDHGDVLTRPLGAPLDIPFRLQRKPLRHQQAMQINVYDDAHRPSTFADDPAWKRWGASGADPTWSDEPDGSFLSGKTGSGEGSWNTLRYSHIVPDPQQWEAAQEKLPLPRLPRPILITDFYSYNSSLNGNSVGADWNWMSPHWVGDLTLSARLEVREASGRVRLELIEGGIPNRCEIDLTTGEATLSHGEAILGKAPTRMTGEGRYDVRLANVDDRLTLWVDGRTPFGDGLEFDQDVPSPTEADLRPAAVGVAGGARVRASGLVLTRDIYYTQQPGLADYDFPGDRLSFDPLERVLQGFDLMANPSAYAEIAHHEPRDYPIQAGSYMMMGDNSPRSKDGRGWSRDDAAWDSSGRDYWEVPETLLIGKAFFVYWPHGKPFWPDLQLSRDFRFPFRPYVERMKWIR